MQSGKWLFRTVILLAVLAGVASCLLLLDSVRTYRRILIISQERLDARTRKRFPNEPSLLVEQDAEYYLALFKSHPERPWYLWRWWAQGRSKRGAASGYAFGLPLAEQTPVGRERVERYVREVETLREMDPDNGYTHLHGIWPEVVQGIVTSKETDHYWVEVSDVRRMANAVELLGRAASREQVTMYGREMKGEITRILGRPATLGDYQDYLRISFSAAMFPGFGEYHQSCAGLVAEARRRAESGDAAAPRDPREATAYDILYDLQSLGARMALSDSDIITAVSGISIIMEATEEGTALLNATGRTEAAASLYARGIEMLRPFLLIQLMDEKLDLDAMLSGIKVPSRSLMEHDPVLLEEAKRLLAQRKNDPNVTRHRSFLSDTFIPDIAGRISRFAPLFTVDDLKVTAHFFLWSFQKALTLFLLASVGLLVLVLLVMYGTHSLVFRNAAATAWPTLRRTVAAGVLFGVVAVTPGLVATLAGNFLWEVKERHEGWHVFWNVWGLVAAFAVLAFWVRLRPGGGRLHSKFECVMLWLVMLGLLLSKPLAYFVYFGALKGPVVDLVALLSSNSYGSRGPDFLDFIASPGFLAFPLLPVLLWGLAAFVHWLRVICSRNSERGAAFTSGLRLFIVGCAGGMLLWLASYWIVDWQEKSWAERETILLPRLTADGRVTTLDSRIAEIYTQNMEKGLAMPRGDF